MMRWDDREAQERVGRLDALIGELEALPPVPRATAMEVVAALVDVYGEGLARIVGGLPAETAEALAGDELVAHLLLVHDLHPVDLPTRIGRALDEVRPYLRSHGGDVELLALEGADVRLRMDGSCHGCPSSTVTLKLAIEDAIRKAAPEVERIEADGAEEPAPGGLPMATPAGGPSPGVLPMVTVDGASPPPAASGPSWAGVGTLADLQPGRTLLREVSAADLLFVRLEESTYAYRPACPSCGGSMEQAALLGADLLCHGCGQRYDVRGAGRCRDTPGLSLEPVPLLVGEAGSVKVALGAGVA